MIKKIACVFICLCLLASCSNGAESRTEFMLDTVCTVTVYDGKSSAVSSVFELCKELENRLSRTVENSEISKINKQIGAVQVSEDTAALIKKALNFGEISGGKFDVTVCSVSSLWDFNSQDIPKDEEINEALKSVDYKKVLVEGLYVNAGGTKIDLGAIAKGYICDKAGEFLQKEGVSEAIVNLGGNVTVIGDNSGKGYNVGIAKPFGEGTVATVNLSNLSAVTSGVYQRYIEKDGEIYHHILDPETGYSVKTDLYSATVISSSSADADALSTVCMLIGSEKAMELIEKTDGAEAFFISGENELIHTSGIEKIDNIYKLKDKIR